MEPLPIEKRKITPQKAIQILEKYGTEISTEEAKKLLDFLYKFGKLTLEQVFKR